MKVPELVYQYAQIKDLTGGSLEIVNRRTSNAANTAGVETSPTFFVCPLDKIFIASNIMAIGFPGAGQTCRYVDIRLIQEGGDAAHFIDRAPVVENAAANLHVVSDSGHEYWIPPGEGLIAHAQFDSGVAQNSVFLYISGFFIPRGNVQQG